MKKLRQNRNVRINIARKRHKRALRSKAKKSHRMGTGHKEINES